MIWELYYLAVRYHDNQIIYFDCIIISTAILFYFDLKIFLKKFDEVDPYHFIWNLGRKKPGL